ncbi:hypothetical protein FKP32DRAFT_550561 [Trametes sanguinea]|nr:hypothetical protein FKP32DRAFT_550561 [Trametes sanguinea]
MSSASIGDLAVEILQHIFSYACTDDGHTGYSLTLVSKAFRDIAHPIRLNCVALHSVAQVESFAAFMDKHAVEAQVPRVRHLFISTLADGQRVAQIREVESARGHPEDLWLTEWAPLGMDLHARLSSILPSLLQTLSSALRTFTIVHALAMDDIPLHHALPHLEELTSFGWVPYNSGVDDVSPSPRFPALQRLHIERPVMSLERWTRHAPSLTHLRLSEVSPAAASLPDELLTLLDGAPPSRPNLRIRLQLRRIAARDFSSTAMLMHNLFAVKLKLLERSPCKDRFEMLQPRRYRDDYWNERLKREWLERIVNGPGCWAAGEEAEEGGDDVDERAIAMSI